MSSKPSPWRAIIESMFRIVPKPPDVDEGDVDDLLEAGSVNAVPFKLNWAQADLDRNMTRRNLVPKARQLGISSYMLGRFTAKGMALNNRRMVLISHEKEATKRLLQRAHYFIQNLEAEGVGVEFELDTHRLSKLEIIFKDTGSWFFIGTAGSDDFSRGDTITDLHGSEVAYWPDAEGLTRALMGSCAPASEVTFESTGNGVANDFAVRVNKSLRGLSHWTTHFYPWHLHPEYIAGGSDENALRLLGDLREELEEPTLVADFGLSPQRLLWRRFKLDDMNGDLVGFHQEFPMTVEECFQSTGQTIFRRVTYEPLGPEKWQILRGAGGGAGWLAGHPREGFHYVLGVDPSGGVGLDQAVIQVGCIEDNEQVGIWWSTRTPPDMLVPEIVKIGKEFNDAQVVVESNNHGLVVLEGLRSKYNLSRLYKRKDPKDNMPEQGLMNLGFQTTSRTKPIAVDRLVAQLAQGFVIHDEMTYTDLQSFSEVEPGRMAAEAGASDDSVMALVMMGLGFPEARRRKRADDEIYNPAPKPGLFSLERMLDDLRNTGNKNIHRFRGTNEVSRIGRFRGASTR